MTGIERACAVGVAVGLEISDELTIVLNTLHEVLGGMGAAHPQRENVVDAILAVQRSIDARDRLEFYCTRVIGRGKVRASSESLI